jgi:hypothetical protein
MQAPRASGIELREIIGRKLRCRVADAFLSTQMHRLSLKLRAPDQRRRSRECVNIPGEVPEGSVSELRTVATRVADNPVRRPSVVVRDSGFTDQECLAHVGCSVDAEST